MSEDDFSDKDDRHNEVENISAQSSDDLLEIQTPQKK